MNTNILQQGSRHLVNSLVRRCLHYSSQKPRPQGKHSRLWSIPGDVVRRKEILARQGSMKWHPGLNVGIDFSRSLYALCEGVMVITEEEFQPDWDSDMVKEIYMVDNSKRAPQYKRYINVIPKKRVPEFKMIDLV